MPRPMGRSIFPAAEVVFDSDSHASPMKGAGSINYSSVHNCCRHPMLRPMSTTGGADACSGCGGSITKLGSNWPVNVFNHLLLAL